MKIVRSLIWNVVLATWCVAAVALLDWSWWSVLNLVVAAWCIRDARRDYRRLRTWFAAGAQLADAIPPFLKQVRTYLGDDT